VLQNICQIANKTLVPENKDIRHILDIAVALTNERDER